MEDSKGGESNPNEGEQVISLAQLLRKTINQGAPLYNSGNATACYELYVESATIVLENDILATSKHGIMLKEALDKSKTIINESNNYKEGAWIMRRCFDNILQKSTNTSRNEMSASMTYVNTGSLMNSKTASESGNSPVLDSSVLSEQWQDENVQNVTMEEKAQTLSDIALILSSSIDISDNEENGKVYTNTFPASAAVEVLTQVGLAKTRDIATNKINTLLQAGLIFDAINNNENTTTVFEDGTHLYRFPTNIELETNMKKLENHDDVDTYEDAQIHKMAIQLTLENNQDFIDEEKKEDEGCMHHASHHHSRSSIHSPEYAQGVALVQQLEDLEKHILIDDRRYRLKTYKNCFIGNEAVTAAVKCEIANDRDDAVQILNQLLMAGLIHHVTNDHTFKDEHLFYRITAPADIQIAIDTIATTDDKELTSNERIQQFALVQRYKRLGSTGLNIKEILNSFYGCTDETGWDVVDLQNWRNNMKRWGFGRREDQDDDMVQKLAPIVNSIDPDTWDVTTGDDEEWESPYGILAQIAIFDQVSRSAYRGTEKAFKWDELAKRATRVAIEKGYFYTAYKSTLNQFLILLPLEHSESWDDQKLGVHLLLQLLSTVAIQDENLSDYEIVKRLEFSKRLTTAFLEHAQVIAKFKRYPHRNKALNRNTTLEERIWLASDLVPRWAKSQQHTDGDGKSKNVIQLPVIPLKRLTKR